MRHCDRSRPGLRHDDAAGRLRSAPRARDGDKPADEATGWPSSSPRRAPRPSTRFNAKAMADYYLDDAEIAMVTKNDEGLKVRRYKGRGRDREGLRRSCSRSPRRSSRRNTVEYAKFLAPRSW